ncbi:MAG: pyridoxamine 5'-phosphate oxidase family protein [Phycisphaeraceae bacterium]|nr:pyridoxamine 5'-phosphate oxidase family protein [Phycisphaeraceae bacterium]
MTLNEYFETSNGYGVLATSNEEGQVNIALYAKPHMLDENTLAFIMRNRRSYGNLQTNPTAAYLYIEKDGGYLGKRLHLTKIREDKDQDAIDTIRRKQRTHTGPDSDSTLVVFQIDEIRPAVGG